MDLRPVNPYYQKKTKSRLRTAAYSYPYTWIVPVRDRTWEDVENLKALNSLDWEHMTETQRDLWLYGTEYPNLLPYPYSAKNGVVSYGVTCTIAEDGSIKVEGTTTEAYKSSFIITNLLSLEKGVYSLSGCPAGAGEKTYGLRVYNKQTGSFICIAYSAGEVFTLEEDADVVVHVQIRGAGLKTDGLVFYPMLNRGSLIQPYRKREITGHKGAINRQDLERIENNIQILMDVLEINGTSYAGKVPEFPAESYFARMKENVAAIREGYCVHETTPKVPELPYNTWEKYNAIEQILADVYEVINAQFHHYAGNELYAGEETGLLL